MTEGIVVAIIGVISSLSVLFMTLLANKISYMNNVRYEEKRKITDRLCEIIHKGNMELVNLKFYLNKSIENYSNYIERGKIEDMKEALKCNVNFFEAYQNVLIYGKDMIFYMENNILPLNKYIDYYYTIRDLFGDILQIEELYHEYNIDNLSEIDFEDLDENCVDKIYEESESYYNSINKIYFYSYNLLVNLQNDTYSKFFNNYKMKEIWDYRYENIELKKIKDKKIELYNMGPMI